MTEDTLKERMAALEAQRRQMEANLNAIAGAMQECQFWLSKLKTPENQDAINAI
jgi:prefoldin subunit 5